MANIAQINITPQENIQPEFAPLPAGKYAVRVIEEDLKLYPDDPNKERLIYKLEVIEGDHSGRFIFFGFNLRHPNPKVEEISRDQLSNMAFYCGLREAVQDSSQLIGKRFVANVFYKKHNDKEYQNVRAVAAYEMNQGAVNSGDGQWQNPAATQGERSAAEWEAF